MIELVDPACSLCGLDHQTSLFEDAQVLGDGGPSDRHSVGELADRAGTACETLEDLPPSRIAERCDRERGLCVSHGLL
ncbi:hypothetical protein VQ02_03980 [Methylobacterium variabile]|uniref:Uncharacterized protein n=1 Tax=Methylobacterium variabile TaxID=298794 RepID=A0A0J6T832_9HYPH|nr:hypothetical protein VQ02_03980 [Methylobacterium variabile]